MEDTRVEGEENLFETLIKDMEKDIEMRSVVRILEKYSEVFSKQKNEIGHFQKFKHDIEVYRRQPIYARPYKIPQSIEKEVEDKIAELVRIGIVKECSSPWNFPLIPIRKKSGDLRLCVDFRRLNEITVKKIFPLPDHQQIIDCLDGAKYFSTLDLTQGYYQMSLDERDQMKSAFTTKSGQYCFMRMPFGMTNSPCSFQRALNGVMRSVNWKKCVIFMDDILVFGKTIRDHNENLESVLKVLKDSNLKVMPAKCGFLKKEIHFLGHVISSEGVKTDPRKTEAMKTMAEPVNAKQLRTFLGMCSYYRKFIKDFSKIAYPLYDLTSPKIPFKWKEEHKKAFYQLKEKMTSSPILCFPNKKDKFVLYTDASEYAIGSVLTQLQKDGEKVIAYASRKLSQTERNYSVTKKELLAIVTFIRQFKHYLWGVEFEVRTDHRSLQYVLRGSNNTSSQFCRWRSELEMYNFRVTYIKGVKNMLADAMSRPVEQSFQAAITLEEEIYDSDISIIVRLLQESRLDERNPKELLGKSQEAKILWARRDELILRDSKLFLKKEDGTERYIVPYDDRMNVVRKYHEDHCHVGIQKTLNLLKMRFYWPRMEETVNVTVKSCKLCSFNKQSAPRDKAPLISTVTGEPFERIAIDITGPFTITTSGNRYVLGIIDHFSKFCTLVAMKNAEAKTVCHALYKHWISLFGAPMEIISDNGASFKNNLKTEFAKLSGSREVFSPPYYPQANGLVERLFRTAKTLMKLSICENKKEWDEVLPTINMALRNSIAQSTGFAPYEIIFGKRARLPVDWQFPEIHDTNVHCYETESEYVIDLRKILKRTMENVRMHLGTSILKQADYYNKNKLAQNLRAGDLVLIRQSRNVKGLKKYQYVGPYLIVKKLGEWTYELMNRENNEKFRRSYNQIKKYIIPESDCEENEIQEQNVEISTQRKKTTHPEQNLSKDDIIPITDDTCTDPVQIENVINAEDGKSRQRRSVRERKQPQRLGFPAISFKNFYR